MKSLFPVKFTPHASSNQRSESQRERWNMIINSLHDYLTKEECAKWITPIQTIEMEHQGLILLTPDLESCSKILDEYMKFIQRCNHNLGAHIKSFKVDLIQNKDLYKPHFEESKEEIRLEKSFEKESSPIIDLPKSSLNPNYTFNLFVNGPSNDFALATCLNVTENLGQNYNPLFIYGPTGLGKTHLLHAVGNAVLQKNKNAVVSFNTSEHFMNEMIHAIRHNKMWDFRYKYRHCDLFLMDDIQFISGNKSATQEEFFHTFNSLYEANKQIIVTSDLFPQEIPDIEERLRNRFQWGLIAEIQAPDMEHRMAILFQKAEQLSIPLQTEVAEYISNVAKKNIRELEGALHKISAYAALQGKPIDLPLVKEIFATTYKSHKKQQTTIEAIQKAVAIYFKIKVADLKSTKKIRALSLPRQIAMYLARTLTNASYPEIGEKFGGKDHTTILHATKKIEKDMEKNSNIKKHINAIEKNGFS